MTGRACQSLQPCVAGTYAGPSNRHGASSANLLHHALGWLRIENLKHTFTSIMLVQLDGAVLVVDAQIGIAASQLSPSE